MEDSTLYQKLGSIEAKLDQLLKQDIDKEIRLRAVETNQWKWMGMASVIGVLVSHLPFSALLRKAFE